LADGAYMPCTLSTIAVTCKKKILT
jgi:hypothetical protein